MRLFWEFKKKSNAFERNVVCCSEQFQVQSSYVYVNKQTIGTLLRSGSEWPFDQA